MSTTTTMTPMFTTTTKTTKTNMTTKITITTDASPYGLRAVLDVDGVISSYFASQITDMDREILSLHEEP